MLACCVHASPPHRRTVAGGSSTRKLYAFAHLCPHRQNAAQKRRSKQKIFKLQQKHGLAEEGQGAKDPVPLDQSPVAAPRGGENPYSGGKDKMSARERGTKPTKGAPAAGPMRRRVEGLCSNLGAGCQGQWAKA